jgi:adenylyl-sulfate kinase
MTERNPGPVPGNRPRCLWLTGLPGSGKTTIASATRERLYGLGQASFVLDGDALRRGLCSDLGFTEADRVENIRRTAEVSRLMVDAGLIVIVALISPYQERRAAARALFGAGEFHEIFVDAPLEVCETRDPKGLYRRARCGEIIGFTGIDAPYERPRNPDLTLFTAQETIDACVDRVMRLFGPG